MAEHEKNIRPISWQVNWQGIDTVLLDMDGTLLDKHFLKSRKIPLLVNIVTGAEARRV